MNSGWCGLVPEKHVIKHFLGNYAREKHQKVHDLDQNQFLWEAQLYLKLRVDTQMCSERTPLMEKKRGGTR